ncbi:MAG: hypothetical protein HC906_02645 [Bacteroidales bacterium]|nr:hypothetical protein [Bacteroidales bacterium]
MLEELLPEVQKTASLVQEITSASLEQSNGIGQVNNAVQQLNTITQQNASASEELASSSEEMASQAEELKETVAFFNTGNTITFSAKRNSNQKSNGIKHGKEDNVKSLVNQEQIYDTDFVNF